MVLRVLSESVNGCFPLFTQLLCCFPILIRKTALQVQLVDAYVRAEYREMERSEFEEFARRLEERVSFVAKEFSFAVGAEDRLELFYEFEQGSLLTIGKIFGALMATYVAISQYPNFRSGVIQLYNDAMAIAAAIKQQFKDVTGALDTNMIYSRTVSRDVNRLYRIVQNVDAILKQPADGDANAARHGRIVRDIADLYHSNRNEHESIRRILDTLSKETPPFAPIPRQIDEVVDLDTRNRWRFTVEQVEPVGRPLARAPRRRSLPRHLRYERTIRI